MLCSHFFLLYEDFKSQSPSNSECGGFSLCFASVFQPKAWCHAILRLKLYQAAHYILPHLEELVFNSRVCFFGIVLFVEVK